MRPGGNFPRSASAGVVLGVDVLSNDGDDVLGNDILSDNVLRNNVLSNNVLRNNVLSDNVLSNNVLEDGCAGGRYVG